MNMNTLPALTAILSALALSSAQPLLSGEAPEQGARLAIIGDSITEQKLYSKYMEAYLLACAGRQDMKIFQFGWGGETAGGFANRLANDLAPFQPTAATTCYGMNDGQYKPFTEEIGRSYEANMRRVIDGLQKAGVKTIVVGSPGAVDTRYFMRQNFAPLSGAEGYNQNLGALRDIDRRLASELGHSFADVHKAMIETMTKAKLALGEEYDVCGRDGFHPGPNGQLIMAFAFLKALGCQGRIAEITLDLKGTPKLSEGHKILSGAGGQVAIESTRYPFCFEGDSKSSSGTRSIAPYLPWNEELNRFVLVVKNLNEPKAKVTWGTESREFTKSQLTAGVNLAAEFDKTPFDEPFKKVIEAVATKQQFETLAIKSLITYFRNFANEAKSDPELAGAFATAGKRLMVRQSELDGAVRKAILPVKHTIAVVPGP